MKYVQRRHAVWANGLGGRHALKSLLAAATLLSELRATLEARAQRRAGRER